ncbi:MAG: trypsin-like serine protease [Planctomycetes bacterium]|nr:trypsin-like serine protease [Planctomycetota bacterium]
MSSRIAACLVLLLTLLAAGAAHAMTIVVTADKADVMLGTKPVASVTKGQTFEVVQQRDVWYGIYVKAEGKDQPVFGWIHSRNCEVKREPAKGEDPLEAEAEKEFLARKAQADKLTAEGKWDEAIALFDKFPTRYWRTKAGKKAMQYGGELDTQRRAKPENLEASAEKELAKRKAEADKLAAAGKLDDAIRLLDGFPASFEKTKAYQEAKKYALELQAKANVSLADFEAKVLDLVKADKFDDALAEAKALEDKKLPGKEAYIKSTRAFIERQKKSAANPTAPVASDNGVADVYEGDLEFSRQASRLLNFRGPGGVTTYKVLAREGDKIVVREAKLPVPAEQIAAGEQLVHVYPWSPNVRYYLAKLYAREGQADKALAHYAAARTLDRGATIVSLDACIEPARLLARAKRFPEAIELLKTALARKADDFIALTTLGRVHLAAGDKPAAAAALDQSLKLNPHQPAARRLLAEAKGAKHADPPPTKFAQLSDLVKQVEESCLVVAPSHGSGSGFVISSDGLIATNFHVIAPGGKLQLRYKREGKSVTVPDLQVVLLDPVSDIAILKADARAHPLKPLPLGSAKDVVAGEDIVAIGSPGIMAGPSGPQILEHTVTKGIISNRDRVFNNIHFFQTDAAVNPGNSGGPLFDMLGRVIGMVTLGTNMQGTGFALHIDQVKAHFPHCFPEME